MPLAPRPQRRLAYDPSPRRPVDARDAAPRDPAPARPRAARARAPARALPEPDLADRDGEDPAVGADAVRARLRVRRDDGRAALRPDAAARRLGAGIRAGGRGAA